MLEISPAKLAEAALIGHELPRGENELRGMIEALNDDERAAIVAVMWIGRGSFEPEDLAEAIATAKSEATTPTADYLLGTPHFADHIEAGMEALGLNPSEAEDALL